MSDLLFMALKAAVAGGKEIIEIYSSDFATERKEDNSPVTLADKNADAIIQKTLAPSGFPALTEESEHTVFDLRKNWKRLWVIDPLDGTREFVKKNGEFTVNIALVENEKPILGVIYHPLSDTAWFAEKGKGAFRCEKLSTLSHSEIFERSTSLPLTTPPSVYTVVASRSHKYPATEAYIQNLEKKYPGLLVITGGSSMKFCLVAEGKAHEYPRFGTTMEWDSAAGQAIIEAVGKQVVNIQTGEPLRYNKEDLRNPDFLVR
jgi:3'(2'), 5'-bisphosphate nucleotidase